MLASKLHRRIRKIYNTMGPVRGPRYILHRSTIVRGTEFARRKSVAQVLKASHLYRLGLCLLRTSAGVVRSDQGRDAISTGSLFPSCTCSSRARHLYSLHVWREQQVARNLFCCHIPNRNLITVAAALSEGCHDLLWSAAVQFAAFTEPTTFFQGWTPDSASDSRNTRTCREP